MYSVYATDVFHNALYQILIFKKRGLGDGEINKRKLKRAQVEGEKSKIRKM